MLLYPDQQEQQRREQLRQLQPAGGPDEITETSVPPDAGKAKNSIFIQDQQNKRMRSPSPRYKDYFQIPNQSYSDNNQTNQRNTKSQHKSGKETIDSNDKSFGYVSVDIGANLHEQENFKKLLPHNYSPNKGINNMSGNDISAGKKGVEWVRSWSAYQSRLKCKNQVELWRGVWARSLVRR